MGTENGRITDEDTLGQDELEIFEIKSWWEQKTQTDKIRIVLEGLAVTVFVAFLILALW